MATNQFNYQACDVQGKLHKGQLNAESEQEVVSLLQARQLIPIQIELGTVSTNSLSFNKKTVSNQEVIEFTNGLCTLIESHIPIDRALGLLENLTAKPTMQTLITDLRREIKDGRSLADALQNRPEVFSKMYINIVHAGEEGGILEKLLPRMAKFLEEAEESRRILISAMIYPLILLVVGILSVMALMIFVVPQFATLFEDMGSSMPESAALLLGLSAWLKHYGWTLLFVPPILWFSWKYLDTKPNLRLQRDQFLLQLPLFGGILRESESSRFCRTLGALLGSGIPLLKALHIARGVMENQVLADSLEQVEESVRRGISLGKALLNTNQFPVLLPQLVIVGEESGKTASILDKLAESFDSNVRRQTSRLVSLVEPLLIVSLGIIVGSVVIIMLSAIFSLNDVKL